MNNYNYGYSNYPMDDMNSYPYKESNYNNMMNYSPNKDSYNVKLLNNSNNNLLEPYEGFIRGNMFGNLYERYKGLKVANINSSNERENMLNQWQQYNFALTDIDLFLDVYPNDTNMIKIYNNYLNISNQIKDKYESMYGPLCLDSTYLNNNSWVWINSPWPWEEI